MDMNSLALLPMKLENWRKRLSNKLIEKLSDKLGVEVKKKVEDTTFTANLAAVAADQVDIMLAGMSPLRNASRIWTSPMFI